MSAVDLTEQPVTTSTDDGDDDLIHVICDECWTSYCGQPWDGGELLDNAPYDDDCLVCDDLDERSPDFCPRCGR